MREGLDRLALDVASDEIVELRNRSFEGHVYNFSTSSGTYMAGGILTHNCDTYISDVWLSEDPEKDPEPRTLESVCQGRFFRSRGFKQFDDIQTLFLENDRATWESEQECSQPSGEGVYIKSYSPTIHGIRDYEPLPENGPIYTGTDWGADDEHAHLWFQLIERDVPARSYSGEAVKVMKAGSLVAFGEIFRAGIGNVALGEMVLAREAEWMVKYPGWRVHERYPDSANLGARLDWRDHLGMVTTSRIKKDFKEEVKYIRTRVGNMRFYIVINQCPNFDESIRSWRAVDGREVHNSASHCMAAFRYLEHNLQVIERARSKKRHEEPLPVAADDQGARVREREAELAAGLVQVKRRVPVEELAGIGGAAESPLRSQGSTMRSEGDWRQNFTGGKDY